MILGYNAISNYLDELGFIHTHPRVWLDRYTNQSLGITIETVNEGSIPYTYLAFKFKNKDTIIKKSTLDNVKSMIRLARINNITESIEKK